MKFWTPGSTAMCEPGCKFGECVGPNKCRCFPRYTGKTCSQDVKECGFKPQPCQHRCVNTHSSYKCFCLSSHMLLPNATCSNSRTCAMTNCQYSCKDMEEGPRCLCPSPGLHLAPNGRACLGRVSGATSSPDFSLYSIPPFSSVTTYLLTRHRKFLK
ncbi:epidermal growth factor-like protein 6 [Bubalus kerabau]|uniref:epidermal growth factor-like protein 6 n=1 Tax=Bubalus carabanensis TaxID=3119969 RepID=UPI00244E6C32|nr:epidermal growth factor-like protein 6 [Bubalus carabanensis]